MSEIRFRIGDKVEVYESAVGWRHGETPIGTDIVVDTETSNDVGWVRGRSGKCWTQGSDHVRVAKEGRL